MLDYDKLKQASEANEEWRYLIDETKQVNKNFAVSNFGRIYSTKTNKIVKQYPNKKTGYYYFYLTDFGSKHFEIMHTHRTVALSFLGYPTDLKDDFLEVDHINEVKADNRLANLQWISQQENTTRATSQERRIESLKKTVELKHKEAQIQELLQENKILKERLSKYEDKAETALALNKISIKKKKLDYKQFIQ